MEEYHGEEDEEQGLKVNWPNKKIEEAKEHHLDEISLTQPTIVGPIITKFQQPASTPTEL